jgi:hypothetical protein
MDSLFPFGFPAASAWYLTLLVVTFALHQAFVQYVAAGSLYLTWATIFPGRQAPPRAARPLAATLRDWLPFGLGAAITAGVAPLLFVQIVYPQGFYTANLLLAWRWLIVIPVLGIAFYLLYLLKSQRLSHWPRAGQAAVAVVTTGCLLFVGFCWTSNHLLSVRPASWPDVYISGRLPQTASEVVSRLLVWLGGAFATMGAVAGWQLRSQQPGQETGAVAAQTRQLATLALGGTAVVLAAGLIYARQSEELSRVLWTPLARPYFNAALFGAALEAGAWVGQLRRSRLDRTSLAIASVGTAIGLVSVAVLREATRLASVDVEALYPHHADAAAIGGLTAFLLFAVINFGLVGFCIWLVRRGLGRAQRASPSEPAADDRQATSTPRARALR